jgi:hypothetical protein
MDEFEFVLHKTRNRTSGIDEINKKMVQMEKKYDKKNSDINTKIREVELLLSNM